MIPAKVQQLTAQFYQWEILGRGWLYGSQPVDLEPPFTPFFGHFVNKKQVVDDGIRHTLFSIIASAFSRKKAQPVDSGGIDVSYCLFPFSDQSPLVTFRLIFPKQYRTEADQSEQLLTMLSYCTRPITFEIVATAQAISLNFICREDDARYVKSQLATFLQGVSIVALDTTSQSLLQEEGSIASVDFGLQEEFMRPIGAAKRMVDPLTGLFSLFEHLQEGEQLVFQVLFNGLINHWPSSIIRSVTDATGGSFFVDAPEMLPLAKEKLSSTLFAATIRILAQGDSFDEARALLQKASFAVVSTSRSACNALIPLPNSDYRTEQRIDDILFHESHRVGMLLNAKELSTFIHIPDTSLITKKLLSEANKTKAAPTDTEGHQLSLGENRHNGTAKQVTINPSQRLKHTHIIGATGTGKSTLLHTMICQDIQHGQGVAVLDPHGDLIESILNLIPQSRIRDVILIDPADGEHPIGFNILKAHSDIEKEVLSSDLVASFRKLSTSWGDQMNSVLANAILAFLESSKGGTLLDLRRFLIEKNFRESFLQSVSDPSISYYWQKEYPLLKTNSIGPILTRLDAFLRPRVIRNMVAQPQGIDFEQVLNTKKILLVKLTQGLIGTENSYLLGSFVVSKIHQAALARQVSQERSDFFVYIDEFQHFTTPSMGHILSGARKYHVGLILAHQDLQQIQKGDQELLHTLLSNAGTRICFRLGDSDSKRLEDGFSFFDATDLQNLGTGSAIVRIEKPEYDFSLSTFPFEPTSQAYASKESIIAHSCNTYSTHRNIVENVIRENMQGFEISKQPTEAIKQIRETRIDTTQDKVNSACAEKVPTPKPSVQIPIDEKEVLGVKKKKEETQHRYLQNLIKKMAEASGYKANIEVPTPDRSGSVDVLIEGHGQQIACEVSVTTDSKWETHNIEKCITAGYTMIFVCCVEKKSIENLRRKVAEKFDKLIQAKIVIDQPEKLFEFLGNNTGGQVQAETSYKGYRVKVEYDAISSEDQVRKRGSVAKIIVDSLSKMKK